MTKDTKRVDELEVGDIVILPYHEGISTVSQIKGVRYKISLEGVKNPSYCDHNNDITYFGNKNKKEKEEIVELQIDYSLLYPYLDKLINAVSGYNVLDTPKALIHQLKNIYELFGDVLDISFVDLKKLYFERKTKSKVEEATKTKRVCELLPGDVIVEPNCNSFRVVSKIEITDKDRGAYRITFETTSPPNFGTYKYSDVVMYLHNTSDLEKDCKYIFKRVKDLCIEDKILLSYLDGSYKEENITRLQKYSDTQISIVTQQGTEAIFQKDKVVFLVK